MSAITGVRVKIPAMFQSLTGGIVMAEVNGSTVGECLTQLTNQFPALRKMFFDEGERFSGYLNVSVNGGVVRGDLNKIAVKPGDEIYPLILIGGG